MPLQGRGARLALQAGRLLRGGLGGARGGRALRCQLLDGGRCGRLVPLQHRHLRNGEV